MNSSTHPTPHSAPNHPPHRRRTSRGFLSLRPPLHTRPTSAFPNWASSAPVRAIRPAGLCEAHHHVRTLPWSTTHTCPPRATPRPQRGHLAQSYPLFVASTSRISDAPGELRVHATVVGSLTHNSSEYFTGRPSAERLTLESRSSPVDIDRPRTADGSSERPGGMALGNECRREI